MRDCGARELNEVLMEHGFVIGLTGLPSSGKTTFAMALAPSFKERRLPVGLLDGDILRRSRPVGATMKLQVR